MFWFCTIRKSCSWSWIVRTTRSWWSRFKCRPGWWFVVNAIPISQLHATIISTIAESVILLIFSISGLYAKYGCLLYWNWRTRRCEVKQTSWRSNGTMTLGELSCCSPVSTAPAIGQFQTAVVLIVTSVKPLDTTEGPFFEVRLIVAVHVNRNISLNRPQRIWRGGNI